MTVKHVLVVDDSKSARFMLRKMLGKINLTADLAESGEEALVYLKDNQPDAIFMDHMMPGLNGLETVEKIKNNPDKSSIPVVMYTSQDGEEYHKNVISHGVMDILPKPASPDGLSAVVRKINELPEIPMGQIQSAQDASNDAHQISSEDIEKMVRKTAEAAVAAAVRYQVIGTMAQQLSKFRKELKLCDEEKAQNISEKVFEAHIGAYTSKMSDHIESSMKELASKLDGINNNPAIVTKIDAQTLEEIKSVANLSSATKAIDAAKETASMVAHESMMMVSDATNESNKKMAKRITYATMIASGVGIFSALAVYLALY
ncbi:MAG: response regulator [Gammaproteobacteria bacterium]|nr:response regulator [Gammaproteobacteria bacterium]